MTVCDGFDFELFHGMCDSSSSYYDPEFSKNLSDIAERIFQVDSLWASRDFLYSVVHAFGKRQGWVPTKNCVYI